MTEELEQLKQIFIDSYEVDLPIKNLDSPFELIDKISNQVQTKVIPNGMVTGGNRYIIQGLIFLRDYKKKFLLQCDRNETPATYKSIEKEIEEIEVLLKY